MPDVKPMQFFERVTWDENGTPWYAVFIYPGNATAGKWTKTRRAALKKMRELANQGYEKISDPEPVQQAPAQVAGSPETAGRIRRLQEGIAYWYRDEPPEISNTTTRIITDGRFIKLAKGFGEISEMLVDAYEDKPSSECFRWGEHRSAILISNDLSRLFAERSAVAGSPATETATEMKCAECGGTGGVTLCDPLPPDTGDPVPLCPGCWYTYFQQCETDQNDRRGI